MGSIFLGVFRFFSERKLLFFLSLIAVVFLAVFGILRLNINTSIYSIFPDQPEFEKFSSIIKKDLNNNLVISVDTRGLEYDEVYNQLDSVAGKIKSRFGEEIIDVDFEFSGVEDEILSHFYTYPYYFLTEDDYTNIEGTLTGDTIKKRLEGAYEQLSTANSIFMRRILVQDPLGIVWSRLAKYQPLEDSSVIQVEDGLLINRKEKLAFIKCRLSARNRSEKELLSLEEQLEKTKTEFQKEGIHIDYFSPFLISNANAKQIKTDTRVTLGITIALLVFLLLFYYRNLIVSFHFITSVVLSVVFGLGLTSLFVQELSGIAIAASAVLLGIVMDYSFHFITHYSDTKDLPGTIKELAKPLLIGSFTTIMAFASMMFTTSGVLKHFGLLALCILASAVLVTLIVLPVLINVTKIKLRTKPSRVKFVLPLWVKRLAFATTIFFILLIFIRAPKASFDSDLNNLSFHPAVLKQKEHRFTALNPEKEKRILLFSEGKNLEEVLRSSGALYNTLLKLRSNGVTQINSIAPYAISAELANERLEKWNAFWEPRFDTTYAFIQEDAEELGFVASAFSPFESLVHDNEQLDDNHLELLETLGLDDLIQTTDEGYRVITSVTVNRKNLSSVKAQLNASSVDFYLFDVSEVAGGMLSTVQDDFNYLLLFSSLLVFFSLLVVYGRIELALFSFFPMAVSWLWILYLGELVGIGFNFVNIIIATIIFGLGDDFSIFVTDGLLKKYAVGRNDLSSYNKAIWLSALTTIIGTGVLIFAKHPAIHSIALLSVVGILSILVVTILLQPYIFKIFVSGRTEKKFSPITLLGLLNTAFLYLYFVTGCILLNLLLVVFIFLPGKKLKKRNIINYIVSKLAASTLFMGFHVKKKIVDREKLDFGKPSILISNHISFLDILLTLKLNPKVIIVVKEWVYNSPFFGLLIRYSGYICINKGNEDNLEKIKQRLDEGYSVMIFPEGTRSPSGDIQRFHKGAFFAAKELGVDIQPILITGAELINPKGDFIIKKGKLTVHVMDRIPSTDPVFDERLGVTTREITNRMRSALQEYRREDYDQQIMGYRIGYNYLYKGPVLEWYFKIKWRLENKNFESYDALIGSRKRIYDFGCGYGYLSFYLHYRDSERRITGTDYDQEKVDIAAHAAYKNNNLDFEHGDLTQYEPESFDVGLLCDVLHYVSAEERLKIVKKLVEQLSDNGMIIIRDGISDYAKSHKKTALSEVFSTKIFKFNKAERALEFMSLKEIENIAEQCGMRYEIKEQDNSLSNVLIILKKESADE